MVDVPVVVIGAGGAVGRALLGHLEGRWPAIAIDRVPLAGVAKAVCLDITDEEALAAIACELPDRFHLIHLAANLDNDMARSSKNLRDNLLGVSTPLSFFGKRLAHVTYVSSISVYGPGRAGPICENEPLAPTTPYAIGKAAGETIARGLSAINGVPVTIFRPAQLFGLKSAEATLPHQLLSGMSAGIEMTLEADPSIKRDYLWVGDVVDALLRQVELPVPGVFNLGSDQPIALGELFARASQRFGTTYRMSGKVRGFDQWLDICRARTELGFCPRLAVLDWLDRASPAEPFALSSLAEDHRFGVAHPIAIGSKDVGPV